jgi:nucleoside-diphosphate-sugar epimerase
MTTGADVSTRTFTSTSWLPLTVADARAANHPYISYCVAKAEADKAIWAYVKENRPHFSVSVFLPALIFGPPIHPVTSLQKMNYSTDVFYALFNGSLDVVPPTSFASYVDVRDLAAAHIRALTTPAVANRRFLVGGHPYSSGLAVGVLRGMPELKGRKLPGDPETVEVVPKVNLGDVEEWNEKLGLKPRSAEETFGDAARRILELEEKFAQK